MTIFSMMLLVVVLLSGANLAGSYIDLGIEDFHLGQVELIGYSFEETINEIWSKL